MHRVPVSREGKTKKAWAWNGSVEKPTLSPSVNCPGVCHFFLREGVIDFCKDSKHKLAGQKVPLQEYKED